MQLLDLLQFATGFYQILILSMEQHGEDGSAIVYKSLIFLGDIARYRASYSSSRSYNESWAWYEKAFTFHPLGCKPHAQLAILSMYKKHDIDVVYYNCLALGNSETNLLPRGNLGGFLNKFELVSPRSNANLQYMVECYLSLFSDLFKRQWSTDLVDHVFAIAENLSFMVVQDLD